MIRFRQLAALLAALLLALVQAFAATAGTYRSPHSGGNVDLEVRSSGLSFQVRLVRPDGGTGEWVDATPNIGAGAGDVWESPLLPDPGADGVGVFKVRAGLVYYSPDGRTWERARKVRTAGGERSDEGTPGVLNGTGKGEGTLPAQRAGRAAFA